MKLGAVLVLTFASSGSVMASGVWKDLGTGNNLGKLYNAGAAVVTAIGDAAGSWMYQFTRRVDQIKKDKKLSPFFIVQLEQLVSEVDAYIREEVEPELSVTAGEDEIEAKIASSNSDWLKDYVGLLNAVIAEPSNILILLHLHRQAEPTEYHMKYNPAINKLDEGGLIKAVYEFENQVCAKEAIDTALNACSLDLVVFDLLENGVTKWSSSMMWASATNEPAATHWRAVATKLKSLLEENATKAALHWTFEQMFGAPDGLPTDAETAKSAIEAFNSPEEDDGEAESHSQEEGDEEEGDEEEDPEEDKVHQDDERDSKQSATKSQARSEHRVDEEDNGEFTTVSKPETFGHPDGADLEKSALSAARAELVRKLDGVIEVWGKIYECSASQLTQMKTFVQTQGDSGLIQQWSSAADVANTLPGLLKLLDLYPHATECHEELSAALANKTSEHHVPEEEDDEEDPEKNKSHQDDEDSEQSTVNSQAHPEHIVVDEDDESTSNSEVGTIGHEDGHADTALLRKPREEVEEDLEQCEVMGDHVPTKRAPRPRAKEFVLRIECILELWKGSLSKFFKTRLLEVANSVARGADENAAWIDRYIAVAEMAAMELEDVLVLLYMDEHPNFDLASLPEDRERAAVLRPIFTAINTHCDRHPSEIEACYLENLAIPLLAYQGRSGIEAAASLAWMVGNDENWEENLSYSLQKFAEAITDDEDLREYLSTFVGDLEEAEVEEDHVSEEPATLAERFAARIKPILLDSDRGLSDFFKARLLKVAQTVALGVTPGKDQNPLWINPYIAAVDMALDNVEDVLVLLYVDEHPEFDLDSLPDKADMAKVLKPIFTAINTHCDRRSSEIEACYLEKLAIPLLAYPGRGGIDAAESLTWMVWNKPNWDENHSMSLLEFAESITDDEELGEYLSTFVGSVRTSLRPPKQLPVLRAYPRGETDHLDHPSPTSSFRPDSVRAPLLLLKKSGEEETETELAAERQRKETERIKLEQEKRALETLKGNNPSVFERLPSQAHEFSRKTFDLPSTTLLKLHEEVPSSNGGSVAYGPHPPIQRNEHPHERALDETLAQKLSPPAAAIPRPISQHEREFTNTWGKLIHVFDESKE